MQNRGLQIEMWHRGKQYPVLCLSLDQRTFLTVNISLTDDNVIGFGPCERGLYWFPDQRIRTLRTHAEDLAAIVDLGPDNCSGSLPTLHPIHKRFDPHIVVASVIATGSATTMFDPGDQIVPEKIGYISHPGLHVLIILKRLQGRDNLIGSPMPHDDLRAVVSHSPQVGIRGIEDVQDA